MPLETMIYKITGLAASTYGLKKKGRIAEGYDADLVLFNKEEIGDAADFVNSNLLCKGIKTVIVGGKIVYNDGIMTEENPGQWIGFGGK